MPKKDKKEKKEKKKSKEKKPKKSKKDKDDMPAPSAPALAGSDTVGGTVAAPSGATSQTPAFSAGQLFERYSRNGVIGISEFQRLVESEQLKPLHPSRMQVPGRQDEDFEVGRLFERFSHSVPGHVTLEEFGGLVRTLRSAGGLMSAANGGNIRSNNLETLVAQPDPTSYASTMASAASASNSVVPTDAPMVPRALNELRNNPWHQPGGGQGNGSGAAGLSNVRAKGEFGGVSGFSSDNMLSALPLASTELHILSMNMMSKRDQLMQQMRYVQARTEEVQSMRRAIERETVADTEAILHRLRSQEQFKLSLLNHDMAQLQHDIDEIDAFNQEVRGGRIQKKSGGESSTANGRRGNDDFGTVSSVINGAATARGRYLETCAEAERIIGKPYRTDCVVRADDFDRETADRIARSNAYLNMEEAGAAKDRMNYKLLQQQKRDKQQHEELKQKIEDFSQRSKEEMEEWVLLCTSLKEQLAKERAKNATFHGGGTVVGGKESAASPAVADPPVVIGTRRSREALG